MTPKGPVQKRFARSRPTIHTCPSFSARTSSSAAASSTLRERTSKPRVPRSATSPVWRRTRDTSPSSRCGSASHAGSLLADARSAAAEASAITPNAEGWLALAEAEYERAGNETRPEAWSDAAAAWERLERPPLAAYCRWREAEALVAAGASRTEAAAPLRDAYAVADRIKAKPLLRELELLAERARLDLASPDVERAEGESLEEALGLTPREAEVLSLIARGYTNREIAATLVISVKTAGVHVSHILRKLGVPNRLEAAAVAHRFLSAERQPT
jgi:DNA-binding CsgD family transcriptional regulator